jgi:predicted phosphodiesterase
MKKLETTLVIGDAHSEPGHHDKRFQALGNFIVDNKPDNIVQIGDFLSLDSINFFDNNNPLIKEGRRLKDDIDKGVKSYIAMMQPIYDLWDKQTRWKTKKYSPNLYWLLGNHEVRTYRYTQDKPELSGFIPEKDFVGCKKDGWIIINYREYVHIEGTAFTHAPMSKRANNPIGGDYVAKKAADQHTGAIVFGHTHRFGVHTTKRASEEGKEPVIQGINVGWYGDYVPSYVKGNEAQCDWWSGLVMLTHTGNGTVDIAQHGIDRVKAEYL